MEYGPDNLKDGLMINCPEETNTFVEKYNAIIDKAHNEYIQLAATIGIPGLITYLIFIYAIIKDKIRKVFNVNVYFIIVVTVLTYMVQAFFNISTIGIAPLFWMLLGIIDNKEIVEYLEEKIN